MDGRGLDGEVVDTGLCKMFAWCRHGLHRKVKLRIRKNVDIGMTPQCAQVSIGVWLSALSF